MTTTGQGNTVSDAVMRKLRLMAAKMASLRGSERLTDKNEAEAFAAAIKDMLDRHNLSMSDVEFALAKEQDPQGQSFFDPRTVGVKRGMRRSPWQEELAVIVAHAHFCRILVVPGSNLVFFVGRDSNRQVAVYVYGMLLTFADKQSWTDYGVEYRKLESAGRSTAPTRGYRAAWLRGFNLRIAERYRAMERETVARANAQADVLGNLPGGARSTALTRRLDGLREETGEFMDELDRPEADEVKQKQVTHGQGLRKGYERGADVDLGRKAVGDADPAKGNLRAGV